MLGDGHCDPACYSAACVWDKTDCECAPGCQYTELGTGRRECLVPACNFDAWTWTADSCANSTSLSCTHVCDPGNFNEEEEYDCVTSLTCGELTISFTLLYCSSSSTPYSIFPVNGRVLPDTSSAEHPVVYYVSPGENNSGSGSRADPFQSLHQAINQANQLYVDLILLPGEYLFSDSNILSRCNLGGQTLITPQPRYFPTKRLRIRSEACATNCEPAVLLVDVSLNCVFRLPEDFELEFANVVITRSEESSTGCSFIGSCRPAFLSAPRGCILTFENTTIRNLSAFGNMVIALFDAKLRLSNVEVVNVSLDPYHAIYFMGFIASNSSAEVVYRGGKVSIFNNDISYYPTMEIMPFLSLQQGTLILEGVHFSYIFVGKEYALITFKACDRCVIANCTFENNFGTAIKYAAAGLQAFSLDWEEAKTILNQSLEISNCVFRNNTGQESASVVVEFGSVLHVVRIHNCSFTNEYAESHGVVVISSSGFDLAAIEGFLKLTHSSNNQEYLVFFPPIEIHLGNLAFMNCTVGVYGLLLVSKLPHLHLSNITFQGNGVFGNVNRFTTTLDAFATQPGGQIPLNLPTVALSSCESIVNITGVDQLVMEQLQYEQFECYYGMYLAGCKNGSIVDLISSKNVISKANGAVLFFNFTQNLLLSEISHSGNRNNLISGQGTIRLAGPNATIWVRNGEFRENKAPFGGVFHCQGVTNLSISNSTFLDNSAQSGGVIYMDFATIPTATLQITDSKFHRNTASALGGVLAFALEESSSTLFLYITNSAFIENRSTLGSAFHLNPLILLGQGLVTKSRVAANSVSETGTFHLAAGSLSLVDTVFEGNSAIDGSGIYRDCSSDFVYGVCELTSTGVSLLRNQGATVIKFLPSLQTKYFFAENLLCSGNSGSCLSLDSTIAQCSNCEFSGNSALSGAGFLLSHSSLTVKYGKYLDNLVEGNGGAGVLEANSTLLCQNCEFVNNTARRQGGALYVKDSDTVIASSSFSRNTAQEGGFAVSLYRSLYITTITNTQFTYNSGEGIGVITLLVANMSLISCTIADNHYAKLTGGISLYFSDLAIRNCEFSNQSSYSGSFLYISQSFVQVETSSFRAGSASSSGGAIAIVASTVTLRSCVLSRLIAELGGAIFLQSETELVLDHCTIKNITVGKTDRGVINGYRSVIQVISTNFANFTQSAIAGEDIALSLLNSTFQQATGSNGGAVSCIDCRSVNISASTFRNISVESRGGALYLAGSSSIGREGWTLGNSTMEGCEAPEGGALWAENCSLTIEENVFIRNKAHLESGQGGAVLLVARKTDKFEVRGNVFQDNKAGLQGGAMCWKGFPPNITSNSYYGNLALYGSDIASFAIKLALISPSSIRNCPSGQSANTTLTLQLLDHYEQRVTSDSSSYAVLTSANKATYFAGTTRTLASMGLFTFSSFSIISPPGNTTFLYIYTTALPLSFAVEVPVSMRDCVMGEAESNGQCVPCAVGSYSLVPGTSCKNCPPEAHCYGNYSIGPRKGYWRASNFSNVFFACPNSAACVGVASAMDIEEKCEEGYERNMCQTCSMGYFRWSRVRCSKCPNSIIRTVGQLILWIVVILLIVLLIKLSLKTNQSNINSIHMKIFLNYLQMVMLFDSFNLAWPDLMLQLFNAQEAVGGFPEFLFSFNCLYTEETELEGYERKWVVLSLLPLLLIAVSNVVWGGVALCRRSLSYMKNQAVGSGIVLFFVAFPSVMRTMLGVLHCKKILSGEYWVVGLDMRCWTLNHLKYALGLAVPCLLIWGLAVPALTFLSLYRQRRRSKDYWYQQRYGFLIAGYQGERFYWEFVIIYRKWLIVALTVFFAQVSLFLQALSSLGVLLASISFQALLQPYSLPAFNTLELQSLAVATLTLYSGLFFYNESCGEIGEILLFAFISLLNLAFTVRCLAKLGYIGLKMILKCKASKAQVSDFPSKSEISNS